MRFFSFFFSSRRRHTRYWRDWSSDVCSSDLRRRVAQGFADLSPHIAVWHPDRANRRRAVGAGSWAIERSEERRVGKECRSRGAPYHQKKKSKVTNSGGEMLESDIA